jgi:hypothetical protein
MQGTERRCKDNSENSMLNQTRQSSIWRMKIRRHISSHTSTMKWGLWDLNPHQRVSQAASSLQYIIILASVSGTIHHPPVLPPLLTGAREDTGLPQTPLRSRDSSLLSHLLRSLSPSHLLLSPFPAHLAPFLPDT